MGRRKEIDIAYKIWLVEECLSGRMRGREAARRAGVGATTMQNWISRYKAEGVSAFEPIEGPRVYCEEVKTSAAEDCRSRQPENYFGEIQNPLTAACYGLGKKVSLS